MTDRNVVANAIGMTGLAGIGGVMGYLYAGMFAVSAPIGIVVGAVSAVAIVLQGKEETENDR